MISHQDRHWLAHHLQSLITRLQADAYMLEHKLRHSEDVSVETTRHRRTLNELSEIVRAYFDAQTMWQESVNEQDKQQWIDKMKGTIKKRRISEEPLASEVADFLETLVKSVTQL